MRRFGICLGLLMAAMASYGQEVVFELDVATEGQGLDAFIINNAPAVEGEVTDPPPGFPSQGLLLGPDTNGIWLDGFLGTDYQIDVVWLDTGQYFDETSGDDADGILTIRGQNTSTDIRNAANAGYNVEREKDADGFGQGSLKIVSFFGDGESNTEKDRRRVNDGTVPQWQGQSFRAHGSQISLVAWEPPEDGNVPPAMEIDFNTPNTVVFWDDTFSEGYAGISWASGLADVVFFRVTDLSNVPAPTPPPPPDDFIIEAEDGVPFSFGEQTDEVISSGVDTKTEGEPTVMVVAGDADPTEDGITDFTFNLGALEEEAVGISDWVIYTINATADQAGLYDVFYRGRNVGPGVGSANIVLRANPNDPESNPTTSDDGITFWDMESRVMRQTTASAGLLKINEGENILLLTPWESGFALDQIQLERSQAQVGFISDGFPPSGADPDLIYRLENAFGMPVSHIPMALVDGGDASQRAVFSREVVESDQIQLLVISATISPGDLLDHYLGFDVPILILEQAITDDMFLADQGGGLGLTQFDWEMVNNSHPITSNFSTGTFTVQDPIFPELPGDLTSVAEPLAPGFTALATAPGDSSMVTLAVADEGAELADGSMAANRRVFMGLSDWNFGDDVRNENVIAAFDAAVEYLIGGETPVDEWMIH